MIRLTPLLLLLTALITSGCAKYGYDILKPGDQRAMVTSQGWKTVRLGEVEYHMTAVEKHLVVQVWNRGDSAMQVLGQRSYIVTPDGRSVGVRGQSVPAGAYMKVVMPPVRRIENPTGPSIGFGVGYSQGPAVLGGPVYLSDDPTEEAYWDWDAGTEARLHLAIERAGNVVEQELVFRRVKLEK